MEKAEIRKMVKSAMNKVFVGNSRENVGEVENHSQEKTKKYFLALSNDEKWAKEQQQEKISKLEKADIDFFKGG